MYFVFQGNCTWVCGGRRVVLQRTRLSELREAERLVLRKVALAKLQALHLGVTLRLPPGQSISLFTRSQLPYFETHLEGLSPCLEACLLLA